MPVAPVVPAAPVADAEQVVDVTTTKVREFVVVRKFVVAHTAVDGFPTGTVLSSDKELKDIDIERLLRLGAIEPLSELGVVVDGEQDEIPAVTGKTTRLA